MFIPFAIEDRLQRVFVELCVYEIRLKATRLGNLKNIFAPARAARAASITSMVEEPIVYALQ